jgi:hypothetical protein
MSNVFYFCAQTGVISNEKPMGHSNFWIYELPEKVRKTVDKAVNTARESMLREERNVLEYPPAFLKMLEKADLCNRVRYCRHCGWKPRNG